MTKLIFIFILSSFLAIGCNLQEEPSIPQGQQFPTPRSSAPTFSESDCEFRTNEVILIKELDKTTCKRISQYFIVDKNNVYKQLFDPGSSAYDQYIILKNADAPTFISLDSFGIYYRDKKSLYLDQGLSYRVITGTDFKTTEILSTHYLKDKDHVYFIKVEKAGKPQIISGFDVNTFRIIQNEENHEQYFGDINGIYFTENAGLNTPPVKIEQVDMNSFAVLNYYLMAKDNNHVYLSGKIIEEVDAQTFQILVAGFFKDKTKVYTSLGGLRALSGWDGSSFEVIGYSDDFWSGYSKDKNRVYYNDAVVTGADPKTFQFKDGKAFDNRHEYEGIYVKR